MFFGQPLQFELVHDQLGKREQAPLVFVGKVEAGASVRDAESADDITTWRDQRRSGVKTDVRIFDDLWSEFETGVLVCIKDGGDTIVVDSISGKRAFARCLVIFEAKPRSEPDGVFLDERNECVSGAKDVRRQSDDVIAEVRRPLLQKFVL
ncbi:hypothetical protein LQ948_10625 [Jiella sp. MQZ9-1]|nr:hypothetical protein [Jiella flava]MCD2471661.1 hypothetical protein [Jiella flava]